MTREDWEFFMYLYRLEKTLYFLFHYRHAEEADYGQLNIDDGQKAYLLERRALLDENLKGFVFTERGVAKARDGAMPYDYETILTHEVQKTIFAHKRLVNVVLGARYNLREIGVVPYIVTKLAGLELTRERGADRALSDLAFDEIQKVSYARWRAFFNAYFIRKGGDRERAALCKRFPSICNCLARMNACAGHAMTFDLKFDNVILYLIPFLDFDAEAGVFSNVRELFYAYFKHRAKA